MIAFEVCVADDSCAEPDTVVLCKHRQRSICVAYNRMLDDIAHDQAIEALVLIREDTEVLDGALFARRLPRI
jgi:hypothetical protein